MMEFTLQPDDFNLVRTGRKRALVCLFSENAPKLSEAFVSNAAREHMRIEVEIVKITVTRLRYLTQDIAVKAGYLYLHELVKRLLKTESEQIFDDNVDVVVVEFRCEGDE